MSTALSKNTENIQVVWDITSSRVVNNYQHSGHVKRPNLYGQAVKKGEGGKAVKTALS